MGKVHILDEATANRIAAGEVVERPSSVVKELVENSIDAGASRIFVHVEEGGLASIRVKDDGVGMEPEDVAPAFLRHATSKIKETRDLFRISTLGFRGEALPSIAAVAKVECITCATDDGLGRKLTIHGGNVVGEQDAGAERGTDILVSELFYNTPARLKYMKTIQTELGHITDYMYRLALSRPDMAFTLTHNGKKLLSTPGNGDLRQVIAAVYGTSSARKMVKTNGETIDFRLTGWISLPEWTRASRSAITTVINRRYVRNFSLAKAVLNAYHTLLPIHRYPVAVVHLEMDPGLVDVNVHPSKLEVKFSKEKQLLEFVEASLAEALRQTSLIPSARTSVKKRFGTGASSPVQEQIDWSVGTPNLKPVTMDIDTASRPKPYPAAGETGRIDSGKPLPDRRSSYASAGRVSDVRRPDAAKMKEAVRRYLPDSDGSDHVSKIESASSSTTGQPHQFPTLYPIGQVKGTYIVAQNEDGLFLIDQHAAHERIHYEQFYRQFGEPAPVSQELLIPMTLEMTPGDAERLRARMPLLEKAGVYLQSFGGNTFKVESYPYWLPAGQERDIIEEIADWIVNEDRVDLSRLRERSAIACSCRASIKANDSLSMAEMESLLTQLGACLNPYTCPHGRPIIVSFSFYELEKMFKRVM